MQDRILGIGVVRTWAPEQRLSSHGETTNGLFAVLDGTVRLVTCRPDGREVLLALARCPTWLGEIGVFDGQPPVLAAMEEVTTMSLPSRLARRLVLMAESYGDARTGTARVVGVKQEELATMLWTSRQTINRCLKELEQRELVRLSYGKVEITDLEGLRREANGA